VTHSKAFYVTILLFYFFQMFGIICSASHKPIVDSSLSLMVQIGKSARIIPIFSTSSQDITPLLFGSFLFLLDFIFLLFVLILCFSSTQIEYNNFKLKPWKIWYVHLYIDLFKWVVYIIKLDLILGLLLC
jgi:hypothetical protein